MKQMNSLQNLDLNLLYTFRVFAECGSVQKTADTLFRSQPAISARLHRLESDLGVTLFHRLGRNLELTQFGRRLNIHLNDVFGLLQDISDEARTCALNPVGTLRINALPTIGVYFLAPHIRSFCSAYPSTEVELYYESISLSLEKLHKGKFDIVFGVGAPPETNLELKVLAKVRPVVVFSKYYWSTKKQILSTEDLRGKNCLSYQRQGDPFFDAVANYLSQNDLLRTNRIRVNHIQTLKTLAHEGAGFALLPNYTVQDNDNLELREVEGLNFEQSLWMASRKTSQAIPLLARFVSQFI